MLASKNRELIEKFERNRGRRVYHGRNIRFHSGIGTSQCHESTRYPEGGQKIQARRSVCALQPASTSAGGTVEPPTCARSQDPCCSCHVCLSRIVKFMTGKRLFVSINNRARRGSEDLSKMLSSYQKIRNNKMIENETTALRFMNSNRFYY
jgi:hypothetical protein